MSIYYGEIKIDSILISELQMSAHIGLHAWEQRILQPVILDITLPIDLRACDDKLENTIDYDELCQTVTTFVESTPFALLETLAERVAKLIQDTFHLEHLTIRACKPHAVKNAGNICVTIER